MNIKRFLAKSSREAMNMVRNELGEDATIISNRLVAGGNEILAMHSEEMNHLINSAKVTPNAKAEHQFEVGIVHTQASPINFSRKKVDTQKLQELATIFNIKPSLRKTIQADVPPSRPLTQKNEPSKTPEIAAVVDEIRQMRDLFSSQLTEISWGTTQQRNPVKKELLRTMMSAGFSAGLAKRITDKCPSDYSQSEALPWAKNLISRNIQVISDEAEILDSGGIFALLGPTGVGKTTTVAKMAARYVMKHGPENLALITTDAYRIGGHEQLRIYGKILGVMVHAVKDEADLKLALREFKGKHTVLIDTVGLSQKDAMVSEQLTMLFNADSRIKKLLCLNAGNAIETLNDVTKAYLGRGFDGCIITKIDEAVTLGGVLNVVMQHKLKVHYLTNGQRVPEDIELMNKEDILFQAFNTNRGRIDLSSLSDDDLPYIVANSEREYRVSHA